MKWEEISCGNRALARWEYQHGGTYIKAVVIGFEDREDGKDAIRVWF
jgi:hypothetical protein